MKRRSFAALTALLLICALAVSVCAEGEFGSISITMSYRGQSVSGGSLTLYHVGVPGDGEYVLTDEFSGCIVSLEDISGAQAAQTLAEYAAIMDIEGVTQYADEEGSVCFPELEYGLYLLVQEQAAEGYSAVSPFLVTVDGDVDATPKLALEPEDTVPTAPPDTPETTEPEPTEPEPTEPRLPQTGQLNWPVPVLAITGLLVFMFGWYLNASGRKDNR